MTVAALPSSDRLSQITRILGPGNYYTIAQTTGYSRSHVSRILRAKIGTSAKSASAIADAANITLDELRFYIEIQRRRNRKRRRSQRTKKVLRRSKAWAEGENSE